MNCSEAGEAPKLPGLESGITLLTSADRPRGALQSLVLDRVLSTNGDALWVDTRRNARTTTLAKIAPSRRILDRIRVARAFTPFQHHGLIEHLDVVVDDQTSLIVVPAIEWFYSNGDLDRGEGEIMLTSVLERLSRLATTHGIPVLVSRPGDTSSSDCIDEFCENRLEYIHTRFGPRFIGEGFETLVFECDGWIQTTLTFWQRVLTQRHRPELSDGSREVIQVGTY